MTKEYIKMFESIADELSSARHLIEVSIIFAFLRGFGTHYIPFTISINADLNHLTF